MEGREGEEENRGPNPRVLPTFFSAKVFVIKVQTPNQIEDTSKRDGVANEKGADKVSITLCDDNARRLHRLHQFFFLRYSSDLS